MKFKRRSNLGPRIGGQVMLWAATPDDTSKIVANVVPRL